MSLERGFHDADRITRRPHAAAVLDRYGIDIQGDRGVGRDRRAMAAALLVAVVSGLQDARLAHQHPLGLEPDDRDTVDQRDGRKLDRKVSACAKMPTARSSHPPP